MLQIIINHEPNKVYISEIKDIDTLEVVSQFDKSKGMVNLEPLKEHIGEQIMVSHFVRDTDRMRFDYQHIKTVSNVGIDEHGNWFMEYH